jgi:hypothetical protein
MVDGGFTGLPVKRRSAPPPPIVPFRIPFGMVTTIARAATTAKSTDTVTRMSATTTPITTSSSSTSSTINNHHLLALYQKELMDIFTTSDRLDSTTATTATLRRLEQLINQLEELYVPPQTLPFLNFAMDGRWQLLFSTATPTTLWTTTTTKSSTTSKSTTTNTTTTTGDDIVVVSSRSSNSSNSSSNSSSSNRNHTTTTDTFRLHGIEQEVQGRQFRGTITNTCNWEFKCPSEMEDTTNGTATRWLWECCCAGTFRVIANYTMTSSGRIVFDAKDLSSSSSSQPLAEHEPASSSSSSSSSSSPSEIERILQLAPGSSVPHNISQLVSDLQRSMAKELLDLHNHAMDTTYLDTQLRIVRYTGPRYESVRNIWIRK